MIKRKDKQREWAAEGGRSRAKRMTKEERSAAARKAALARWGPQMTDDALPRATHSGELSIGDMSFPCAVLDDGRRVISQIGVRNTIGGSKSRSDNSPHLPPYLSSKSIRPFISNSLATTLTKPIIYQTIGHHGGGNQALGIEAELITDICDVWLQAREAGALHHNQQHIAAKAERLVRGLAKVGIVALVDEATGYQDDRARDELAKILEAYIAEELRPWVRVFPHSFYKQVYRIYGWEYRSGPHHPRHMGRFIHDYIYKALPEPVLPELKRLNPVTSSGNRRHKHHQLLSEDTGVPTLDKVILKVTTVLQLSKSPQNFKDMYKIAFPEEPAQGILGLDDEGREMVEEEKEKEATQN